VFVLTEVDPQPTATVSDVRVTEGTTTPTTADIVMTMSAPINAYVEFYGTPQSGTATSGPDFGGTQPYCNVAPGETQCVLHIPIVNDDIPEPDETFTLPILIYGWAVPSLLRDKVAITIVNDDAAFTPSSLQVSTGAPVALKLDIGQAPAAPLTIPLQSSAPDVVEVPAAVTFQPGQRTVTITAQAARAGRSRITAPVPGTSGASSLITVVDGLTIVANPQALTLRAGNDGNIRLSVQPPRALAVNVGVSSSNAEVATVPALLSIPVDGNATLTIHALKSGVAMIAIVTPEGLTFSVDVTVVDGATATQIDPPKAPTSGGTAVTIIGEGLDGRCSVSFGTAAGADVTPVSNGISVVVPPHDAGTVDVTVVCGATRIVLPSSFTYFAPRRHAAR